MTKLTKLSPIVVGIVLALMSQAAFAQSHGQVEAGEVQKAAAPPGQLGSPSDGDEAMAGAAGTLAEPAEATAGAPQPSISSTTLTYRSHQIAAGGSAGNLEGNSCPATYTMISGACHPGYNDQVIIINQYPNRYLNTWRCGFSNNTGSTRTVWVYTLCAK